MFLKRYSLLFILIWGSVSFPSFSGILSSAPAELKTGAYKHFKITKALKEKILGNDRLELIIDHRGTEPAPFFLTFEDDKSSGYWDRLNFKTTLFPGVNKLGFDLDRQVGEKGSNTGGRKLDFEKLKKIYAIVDPDGKLKEPQKILLKNSRFFNAPKAKAPKDILFFDFGDATGADPSVSGAKLVTEKDHYSDKVKYGFTNIDLWKVRDSQSPIGHLRTALSVNQASFKVKLKPGTYVFELFWDELGYWDPPFWSDRTLYVNGKIILKEFRGYTRDFMKDYLSLMEEPPASEDIYDFYYGKIFKPVKGRFEAKKGEVVFTFKGDPTGASLNTLLIYPADKESLAKRFKAQLKKVEKNRFTQAYRENKGKRPNPKKLQAFAFPMGREMRAQGACPKKRKTAKYVGGSNGHPILELCLQTPSDSRVTYTVSMKQKTPKGVEVKLGSYTYRPKSVDLNHETFEIRAEDLRLVEQPSIDLNGYDKRFLTLQLVGAVVPGNYKGEVTFSQDAWKTSIPFEFKILKKRYDKGRFKAGFIGLSPFPRTYFNSPDLKKMENAYRLKALELMQDSGFTLFTETPAPSVEYDGAAKNRFKLDSESFDRFLRKPKTSELFFYNGAFPENIFSGNQRNAGQNERSYWDNMKEELSKLKGRHKSKKFVYLYSDEATGYRNAVEEDIAALEKYKKIFPQMKYGGFGNLNTWKRGKELYKKWDYGLYSDIPDKGKVKELKEMGQEIGVYNLCAEPGANLFWCFGPQLFLLREAGAERYLEWHASAVHNYPGFDLDGRESDIALFYPSLGGGISVTRRFISARAGMELALKLDLIDKEVNRLSALDKRARKTKKWLDGLKELKIFPVSQFRKKYSSQSSAMEEKINRIFEEIFSK